MTEIRVLSGLLGLLLVGAYLSWFGEDASTTRRVTLVDAPTKRLERLVLETPTATTTLEMRTDARGASYPWIRHAMEGRDSTFVGGERVEEALERLFPLSAERSLGSELGSEELASIGLDPTRGRLEIDAAGVVSTFDVGGRTGGERRGDFYVRRSGQREVFLVAGRDLENIQRADRGRQRTIRSVERREVAEVRVARGDAERTLLHLNRTEPDSFWALESEATEKAEKAGRMVETMFRLTVLEFPDPEPEGVASKTRFTWLGSDGDELGRAELGRVVGPSDPAITDGAARDAKTTWVAKSPETHRWGRVPAALAQRIDRLARGLLGDGASDESTAGDE